MTNSDYTMRKSILLIALIATVSIATACGSKKEDPDSPKSVTEAAECGKVDAMRVIEAPAETMERENAILFIRSRESQLRAAGYVKAAESYIEAAEAVLRDSLIIK
jgi:hypothetical protein